MLSPGRQSREEHQGKSCPCLPLAGLSQNLKNHHNFGGARRRCARARWLSSDHCAFDRIRRIECALISGQCENSARAALAMLQRRAPLQSFSSAEWWMELPHRPLMGFGEGWSYRSWGGGKPVASHLGTSSFSVLWSITVFWKCAIFQMPSRLTIVKEARVFTATMARFRVVYAHTS